MTDTPDVAGLVDAARSHLSVRDYQTAYDFLQPAHEAGQISNDELRGQAAYYLGEACLGLDGLDAAMYYYEEAAQIASSEFQQSARQRIGELRRHDDASEAAHEGVAGVDEADSVLQSGDDALARSDYETARQWYTHAYDGVQMTRAQISRAATGLAACHAHVHEFDEAEGYLQVAEGPGGDPAAIQDRITELRATMASMAAGDTAIAGGIERDELDELSRAGVAASMAGDFESAYRYFLQMYESPLVSGTERGRAALNLGYACLWTHDFDAAHQFLTEASTTAPPETAGRANEILARMAAVDDAYEVAAELAASELSTLD